MKKILLISMPWQNFMYPSIQLGVLKASIERKEQTGCDTLYAYLHWAEYICEKWKDSEKEEVFDFLNSIALNYAYQCLGDWIFTKALYGYDYKKEEYLEFLKSKVQISEEEQEKIERLYEDAPGFTEYLWKQVQIEDYDIIGFTNTFSQTVSSLAFAKSIKDKFPDKLIIMGGANCDDIQGKVLLKQYSYIDYIFSGEGENSLPEFIDLYDKKKFKLESISGLIYRNEDGQIVMNSEELVKQETVFPDYNDYFKLIEELAIGDFIQPKILLETAKGCWWGDKSHCAFCGINEKRTVFRCRTESVVLDKIQEYSEKYKCGDIFFVDNIMGNQYYDSLLPKIRDLGFDYNLFWEIKANLTREKAIKLRDANVRYLQPGIENFSTEVLKEMNKGILGIQNIYTLKLARQYGLTVSWNMLYGLPKEKDEYYIVDKWRSLFHLEAPISHGRIILERHSPLFNDLSRGIINQGPIEAYSCIYQFNEQDKFNFAYMFENERCGISVQKEDEISKFVNDWNHDISAVLYYKNRKTALEIIDTRSSRVLDRYIIDKQPFMDALCYLDDIQTYKGLFKYLTCDKGYEIDEIDLRNWLDQMIRLRFLYNEGNKYLSLVLPYARRMYNI